jgi:hypothetical protein
VAQATKVLLLLQWLEYYYYLVARATKSIIIIWWLEWALLLLQWLKPLKVLLLFGGSSGSSRIIITLKFLT